MTAAERVAAWIAAKERNAGSDDPASWDLLSCSYGPAPLYHSDLRAVLAERAALAARVAVLEAASPYECDNCGKMVDLAITNCRGCFYGL